MAFSNVDVTWINAVEGAPSYTDAELRRADAALVAGAGDTSDPLRVRGGIVRHASNSLAVTVDGSDVVTVQPGAVVIPGNDTNSGGVYRSALAAVETGTLTARDATNSRIDLVVFEIISGGTQARARIIAGTPSGSPVVPALPTRAVELARITVPASGGAVATVDNSNRAYAAGLGGVIPCTSTTRPAHVEATVIYELDTDLILASDGAAWHEIGVARTGWTAYTPTWTAATTNPGLGNGTITGRYRKIGSTIHFRVVIATGSTTTYGSGQYSVSLPSAAHATGRQALISQALIGGGLYPCRGLIGPSGTTALLYCDPTSAGGFMRTATATTPATFADGSEIVVEGTYEAA